MTNHPQDLDFITVFVNMFDRNKVRPFQDFSGSSSFFTVEHFYEYGICKKRFLSLFYFIFFLLLSQPIIVKFAIFSDLVQRFFYGGGGGGFHPPPRFFSRLLGG